MKNVFLLFALVCSTGLFAQNKFNGIWKQDYSDYLLHINLSEEKEYKIYFYNSNTEDGFFENIIYNDKEKIKTIALFSDGSSYSCEYSINENGNIICFFNELKEKLIYKKILTN
jgi:hypothetical protein